MRRAESSISLPSFDELANAANQPRTGSFETENRSCSVIRPVAKSQILKVAAYCRVSTDKEDQKSSIRIQRQHFSSLAAKHPDWDFVGVYADVISGTKMEKRPELQRLLSDCAAGNVNLVLAKSISRFARNTTDLLEMVRSLTADGTDICFERENIDTRTMDSEFLLTILGSLAEDESHSISANCRWGTQKRFKDGTYRPANAPYGYDLVDGTYAVNEAEAEIVREIFRRRLAGDGTTKIAHDLNARGIATKRSGQVWKDRRVTGDWTAQRVHSILIKEAYIGDLLLQKSYTDRDFRMKKNYGEYPQYYIKDHHPAIISPEDYEAVQRIIKDSGKTKPQRKEHHTFSGMLFCAECGSLLYHTKGRFGVSYWVCKKRRKRAADCSLPYIPSYEVENAFVGVLDGLKKDAGILENHKDRMNREYRQKNQAVITECDDRLAEIGKMMSGLDRSRERGAISPADYLSQMNELKSEKLEIERQLERMKDNRIDQTEELQKLINSRCGSFLFEENTFTQFIEKVTVHGRGHFTFHFRCGLDVEERSSTCR